MAATAGLLLTTALVSVASGHGNVSGPASRNYGCMERWGTRHQSPLMATEDPMCHQAWRADPNAMWNWNGLFLEGVGGNHQAAIPDGQLCSAGQSNSGRYNALDAVGNWRATPVNNTFTLNLFDQASHGADYVHVYVTRQGFNPLTEPLGWGDLERVAQVGDTPASGWDNVSNGNLNGVSLPVNVTAPGRTGRHIVYTVWQASHLDQSYYFCSDVTFPGGSGGTNPTPVVTTPPADPDPSETPSEPSETPSEPTSPTPGVTTSPPGNPGEVGGCTVDYTVSSQWPGAFQANVEVTAGSAAIRGWTVAWTYANGQQVQQSWGATLNRSGNTVTASNVAYNGVLGAGASTSFGLIASWTGTNDAPVPTCTATI